MAISSTVVRDTNLPRIREQLGEQISEEVATVVEDSPDVSLTEVRYVYTPQAHELMRGYRAAEFYAPGRFLE